MFGEAVPTSNFKDKNNIKINMFKYTGTDRIVNCSYI